MPEIVWDNVEDRTYETGLDRGVLYLPDGSAVPWNGLTSIIEQFDKETSPVYYDGMKISDAVVLGDFAATMRAVTYPDQFVELEGLVPAKHGFFYADQPPGVFGLCYRTMVGDPIEGEASGYKIHIVYNVTAIPKEKTYASLNSEPSLIEFEWDIVAVPEEVPGFRPTAHIVIDTTKIDSYLLADLEDILYGSRAVNASLIPMAELAEKIRNYFRVEIIDHGDGTWTARSELDQFIFVDANDQFQILGISAYYLDDDTFVAQSTTGVADVPQIKIWDVGDGTWTAATEYDALINETAPGQVDILNANILVIDAETYQISDTPEPD